MIIKQKNQIAPKNSTVSIIYGLAGVGKTTLCGKNNSLLFDLENGVIRSSATCQIATDATLSDIINVVKNSDFNNITIDTGDELIRLISGDCRCENPKLNSASQTLRLYGAILDKLIFFVHEIRKSNKNIVFICHGKKDESTDVQRFIPRFGSENNNIELFKICDQIGYLYAQGNDRYLNFEPNDFNNCKNSLEIPLQKVSKKTDIFEIFEKEREKTHAKFNDFLLEIENHKEIILNCKEISELKEIGKELRAKNITDSEVVRIYTQKLNELDAKN